LLVCGTLARTIRRILRTAGARNFAAVGAAALEMEQSGAVQISGASGQMTMQKGLAIAQLREDLRAINRTARALAVDDSAVGELFRMPNGSSEQKLLAVARSFLTGATPLKDQFIEYGLPDDFIEDLQADINDFEQSVTEKSSASGEKVSATASIGGAVKNGLEGLRRLRAIVPNKYRDNSAKLAAWTSASHIERAAKKKKAEIPPKTQ
jgi:hypothetical protein